MYDVYEHVFPDGKRYIGLSKNVSVRWQNNGAGYMNNKKMRTAIEKYGWENVQHNIIETGLTRAQAQKKEMELIDKYDTIDNGYNIAAGGTAGPTLYNRHVMKILQVMARQTHRVYADLREFARRMYELAEDEIWATQVNLIDVLLRTEITGYMEIIPEGEVSEAMAFYYYIGKWVCHPETKIQDLKTPRQQRNETINTITDRANKRKETYEYE